MEKRKKSARLSAISAAARSSWVMARVEMALSELTMKCGSSCRRNILSSACVLPRSRGPVSSASRSEEHTSELQSLMRISYAVFCLKKKTEYITVQHPHYDT